MENLHKILEKEKYKKVRIKVTRTNHLMIKAAVNGVKGSFILDTGASSSCVGLECIEYFALKPLHSETKAAGAGASGMHTQLASKNKLKIGTWNIKDFDLVVFDLSHVNAALEEHHASPVQGILGADILIRGKAVIDYYNGYLYLRKPE